MDGHVEKLEVLLEILEGQVEELEDEHKAELEEGHKAELEGEGGHMEELGDSHKEELEGRDVEGLVDSSLEGRFEKVFAGGKHFEKSAEAGENSSEASEKMKAAMPAYNYCTH